MPTATVDWILALKLCPGHGSLSVSPISCLQGIDSSLQDFPEFQGQIWMVAYQERGRDAEIREKSALGATQGIQAPHIPYCLIATPPLNHCYKLAKSSCAGTQVLRHKPVVFPFVWQSNKAILFYVTQNSFLTLHWAQCRETELSALDHESKAFLFLSVTFGSYVTKGKFTTSGFKVCQL